MITFLFLFFQLYNAKIISEKFNDFNGRPTLQFIYMVDNSIAFPFVNTFHSFTLIENKLINKYNNKDLQRTDTLDLDSALPVVDTKEDIMFNDIKMSFKQYIYIGHTWYPDQGVGLGFKFKNEEYSFIHQLYKNKHIERLIFAFHFDENKYGGSVLFGGVPNDINDYNKYKGNCKVDDNFSSWGCNVTNIKIKDFNIELNNYATFHSTFYGICYSKMLFKLFSDILKEQIKDNICGLFNEGEGINSFIMCDRDFLTQSNLTLEVSFNNLIINLPIVKLFERGASQDRLVSIVYSNPSVYYSNYDFVFGSHFFKLFNYTVFDYENKEINMYSNSISINMIEAHSFSIIKTFYLITSVILLLFISYIIIFKTTI